MLVFRTICHNDWKGRPYHSLVLVTQANNRKEAVAAMDEDVAKWMANDLAADEWNQREEEGNPPEDGWDVERAGELLRELDYAELKARWMAGSAGNRWEMELQDADHREFVERVGDGEFSTIVYHLMGDDHIYTERK